MLFDAHRFLADQQIPTAPSGHKHARPGWVGIICPFCEGNFGYHLGYNLDAGFWNCYRCGWWPHDKVIAAITGLQGDDALMDVMRPYIIKGGPMGRDGYVRPPSAVSVALPDGCGPMADAHRQYLAGRGYDPDILERRWGLQGTGHTGEYKFRVIAPVLFQRRLVSYQGRDITGRQPQPYKACSKAREAMHHKHTLYGLDHATKDACVVVEGITGVWRLGAGAVATFGAKVNNSQIRLLANFKRVFLMFDPDPAGDEARDKTRRKLGAMGVDVEYLELATGLDSGNLPQNLADKIMKEVLG